ncbi:MULTISPECIES: Lon protease family protein [Nitrosomonas]|uniref:endopeptidase La n=1 Tax=Nitrosomonas communis TaxID=44574 RepID=A0A0F7KJC8_9PROT|nr:MULTISPECIES: ATP-binding protein [Nitrosomonas]AKH38872.1 ATP-dependent protease [Nitrosomonas communis]TYP91917.1 putative ATP-dependent protease [Nitrosomonas communis]UVS61002.1 AAA family ATPase [Nitrosomonas sp. PLL12]
MPIIELTPHQLRLTIDPDLLGFTNTSELVGQPLSWIGQERAEKAAYFGLEMEQPDYNLFVLGEVGSGRSSLLRQAMAKVASNKPVPPDLCYLHHFGVPERPLALHLPAGEGRLLRQKLTQLAKYLQTEIPRCLEEPALKAESKRIEKNFKLEGAKAFAELDAFAEKHHFAIQREAGRMVFTLMDKSGKILTEPQVLALPKERRAEIEEVEQALQAEIARYFEKIRPLERIKDEALITLQRNKVKLLLEGELKAIRSMLKLSAEDRSKFDRYLGKMEEDILENVALFKFSDTDEEKRKEEIKSLLVRYQINLVVDNHDLKGAPVIIEESPSIRSLFGSIEYQSVEGVLETDFTRIRAGSLLKAHGGFLMLHLDDVLVDSLLWEKLCRLLRSHLLQIEEPGTTLTQIPAVSLEPEAVRIQVKIILIGSREQYYILQEENPELARRFRIKVDFADSFIASAQSRLASSIFVAHACHEAGLPHFTAAAVARLLEDCHRAANDQSRQSAIFSRTETLVLESAAQCKAHTGCLVDVADVENALQARIHRHNYPDQCLQESIADGDVSIVIEGKKVGQINGLTQIDLGDHCFGAPVRITAHTFAGENGGVLNIEREVGLSGPIHDKGMFILQSYLAALFAHIAPLALSASIVFEQEYNGIEGDSASCAEWYALLSALSGVPLKQGIAVTGAINQYGEILPVGGLNEKIEGFFNVCEKAGLDGTHGVLIPHRNRRHLMLSYHVIEAVTQGLFHIYTAEHVSEGIELLTDFPAGFAPEADLNEVIHYPYDSVLGYAQKVLRAYRIACQLTQHTKAERRRFFGSAER